MTEKRVKSHQLTVRLEPKIYEDLVEVGVRMGVKPAVLAGVAIGDFTSKSKASYDSASNAQDLMVTKMFEHFAAILTPEKVEEMMLKQD